MDQTPGNRGSSVVTNAFAFARTLTLGVSSAALLIGLAGPAFAQDLGQAPTGPANPNAAQSPGTVAIQAQKDANDANNPSNDAAQAGDVVVTGTLFRRTNTETASPVTVLTSQNLEQRGINTVEDAVQRLSANGAGTLPTSFSANGAFAAGASAPSLRGLTTDSTLVLFDGLRAAYYPLADDGVRNFVDINTIPDAIVDRIEVLKDGASSTYGADAVAGVINVITKKQITGIHANVSSGISERGDAGERRIDVTSGYGDLTENKFNFYVSGEYQKNDSLYNNARGYPFDTSDLSHLCGASGSCRNNNVANGIQYDGSYAGVGTTTVPDVRAYSGTNTAIPGSAYGLLNPAAGCGTLPTVTLNAAQLAAVPTARATQCQLDLVKNYGVILPSQQRLGGSARLTVALGSKAQAYLAFNFAQNDVRYTGTPQSIRNNTPAGGTTFSTTSLALPVYVCPRNGASAVVINNIPQVAGCSPATGGVLNPNNPFAAQGQTARILYRLQDIPLSNRQLTNTYRAAGGVTGTFGNGFNFAADGTYMKQNLTQTSSGYIYVQHLLDEVADGSYNFVNPSLNSQAVRNYLTPTDITKSSSELYQIQGNVSKELFTLPGGPLQVAIGGSYRHESIFAPSANPVTVGAPTQRYFTINGFGTSGQRNVKSGYFEINAPIFNQLELNGSGRYDSYSTGQNNFSPKIGGKFTPIRQVAFRSTFSKGFRIPSFAESFGLPTTGYITQTPTTAYQNSPACLIPGTTTKYAYCTAQYSLGLTSVGNTNLKPEKSTSFTAGVIIEPIRNVSLSVDYYNIYKKGLITGANYSPQIAAYYGSNGGGALTPGITGIQTDPNYIAGQGPYPLLTNIQYGFINADSAKSTGIDFDLEASVHLTPGIKLVSSLEGNYVIELSQTIDGVKQRYDDTLGPYQTTSASGTPKWRASWQNTLDFGAASLTGTVYYTAGYQEGAEDDGDTRGVCAVGAGGSSYAQYRDGSIVQCRTHSFIDVDLTGQIKVNDKFTFYLNVLNVFDVSPPYDPSTYGGYNYNPAWANQGIIGRYFRAGARVNF